MKQMIKSGHDAPEGKSKPVAIEKTSNPDQGGKKTMSAPRKRSDKAISANADNDNNKSASTSKKTGKKAKVLKSSKFDPHIVGRLKSIVANYTPKPELLENIEKDTTIDFKHELNIDSVDIVEIIVDAEQEFDIAIKDEEIRYITSFEGIYRLIETKLSGDGASA